MDLGAGSAYNTLDFFLVTYKSILVTTPEITSILNAYSFLKSSAFRFFTQQFKRNCVPDGVKVGTIGLSPRGDLRMPSDASFSLWMEMLEQL